MKYEAIIFDLDGVICHTDKYHYMAWKRIADRLQIQYTPAVNHRMRGVDRMASLDILLGERGKEFSIEEKEKFAAEKNAIYIELLGNLDPASVSQDVRDTLHELRTAGLKLAIGSSSKNTKYILERLGLSSYFDGVSDGTNVTRAKPDPEVFLKAAEMVGIPSDRCLVVEDAEAGILAATAAGMDSAAVGEAGALELATYRLQRISDLLRIVAENGKGGEAMNLAADIGGTKLLFGLFETEGEQPLLRFSKRYSSRDFLSLEDGLQTFLTTLPKEHSHREIKTACFSVAGPVVEGASNLTNLGWRIEEASLAFRFPSIGRIMVRNDMEAMGKGLTMVAQTDIVPLLPGQSRHREGNQVMGLLVPGTGLGEAYLIGDRVMPSEGGHCDFGPRDRLQAELWEFLHRETGHVSYERILSGEGFCRLVRFLLDEKGIEQLDFPLVPEEITRRARSGRDDLCDAAVQLFANVLGAEAGNLALKTMALGGVYLGGNIVKEILTWLQASGFAEGFYDKGRFSDLMKTIPVFAVLDSNAALYGGALMAAETGR